MTVNEVMKFLSDHGSEQTRKVLRRHGARDPFFGVKVADLQKIRKKIRKDYMLSMELYRTGNTDAMYLAGLISDPEKMTEKDLNEWVEGAYWYMLSDYTVADTAARCPAGFDLALSWIDSGSEFIESAGWSTLSAWISYYEPDRERMDTITGLLDRAGRELHESKNRTRYSMNGFIIACGSFLTTHTEQSLTIAESVGKVTVDMVGTACKVPPASASIKKVIKLGRQGKKRNS